MAEPEIAPPPIGPAQPPALWVLEGGIDFPVQLPTNSAGATTRALYLFLGGADVDGFVELRPVDQAGSSKADWWMQSQPVVHRLRACVRAPDMRVAILRGAQLMEHVADRLAFMAGGLVRPLSIRAVYNEEQLRECVAGRLEQYDCTTGGEVTFATQPIRNGAFLDRICRPPAQALTALRWFRRGMAFAEKVDQFIAFYIALESIAEHLPGVEAEQRACKNCGFKYAESKASAGIALLIERHPEWPAGSRQYLAMLRARIVHGNADDDIRYSAAANAPAVQRLAADGIATVLGIDPAQIQFSVNPLGGLGGLQPEIIPIMRGKYEKASNPLTTWDGRFLSDLHRELVKQTTDQQVKS